MVRTVARLHHREEVAPRHHLLELEAPEIAERAVPGQFVHLRVAGTADPLLRRPLSILRADKAAGRIWLLARVVGRGTEIIAQSQPGNVFDVVGPLGNGFPVPEDGAEIVLVAGGVGVAPLIFLADRLRSAPEEHLLTGLYGAATEDALVMWTEFSSPCDEFACATEDGSAGEKGLVTRLLARKLERVGVPFAGRTPAPRVYTCGPRPMMAAVQRLCTEAGVACWASLEQFMGCGIGACLGCAVPTRLAEKYQRVCKDGPVFRAEDIVWEELDA